MKIILISILLIFFTLHHSSAQTIQILSQPGYPSPSKTTGFEILEPVMDTILFDFIGTIQVVGNDKNGSVHPLYKMLKEKAKSMGANCYKVNTFVRDDNTNTILLKLDLYSGNDSIMRINFKQHEKNVVYILGDERITGELYSFKVNKQKKAVWAGKMYRVEVSKEHETKVSKGGAMGVSFWIKWAVNKPNTFLNLTGFSPSGISFGGGGPGLIFSSGNIEEIDKEYGYFLIQILPYEKIIQPE